MSTNENPRQSFSDVLRRTQRPTRDQAIVVDAVEGYPLKEYAYALGDIVNPADVLGFSRIAQGRVCFYLNSIKLAEELVANKSYLKIRDSLLPIRLLNSKNVRLVISNVQLDVPDSTIEDELKKLKIKTVSRMQDVRSGLDRGGFSHWVSFRRQVFIHPGSVDRVPPSLQISHEGVAHNVYLSTGKMKCVICSEEGHVARFCKDNLNRDTIPDEEESDDVDENNANQGLEKNTADTAKVKSTAPLTNSSNSQFVKEGLSPSDPRPEEAQGLSNFTTLPVKNFKRPPPSISSEEEILRPGKRTYIQKQSEISKDSENHYADTNKITDIVNAQLLPAKSFIEENQDKYCLDFEGLSGLLVDIYGKNHTTAIPIARRYNCNLSELSELFSDVYAHVEDRNLKTRLSKYIKRFSREELVNRGLGPSDSSYVSDSGDSTIGA